MDRSMAEAALEAQWNPTVSRLRPLPQSDGRGKLASSGSRSVSRTMTFQDLSRHF